MKVNDIGFLSVTNSLFLPIASDLIKTLWKFHPDVTLYLVCVNVSDDEIERIKSMHKNLKLIVHRQKFDKLVSTMPRSAGSEDSGHEEGYCTSCRSWFMLDVMKETGKSIFYLDADVYLKESIEGLFPKLQECDFMIRSKPHDLDNPEKDFRCNAGMVWVKNTEQNKKLVSDWADKTREMGGTSWRSNQFTLNEIIRENWNNIVYKDFPVEYNGKDNNPLSKLSHLKSRGKTLGRAQ